MGWVLLPQLCCCGSVFFSQLHQLVMHTLHRLLHKLAPAPGLTPLVRHAIRKPARVPLPLTFILLDRPSVQWPALAPGLTSLVWHDIRKPDGWDAAFAHVAALEAQVEPMEGAQLFQASLKLAVL